MSIYHITNSMIEVGRVTFSSDADMGEKNVGDTLPKVSATGSLPVRFEIIDGSLPPGITFESNGAFSGSLTTAGDYSFVVRGTAGFSSSVLLMTLTVV